MEALASSSGRPVAFRTKSQTLQVSASSSQPAQAQCSCTKQTPGAASQTTHGLVGTKKATSSRRQDSQKLEAASFPATLAQGAAKVNTEQFSSFEDMIADSQVPVLVDFYAPWCGPCELMSRVVAKLSTELAGSLKVVKINTDNYPKLASKYRIQGLPTCLLFRDGKLIDRVDGFMPEQSFGRRVRFYVSRLDAKFGRR